MSAGVEEDGMAPRRFRKLLHRAVTGWKREYYAREYGDGHMTLARSARDANVSLWEMMDTVRQRKIAVQYDLDDLRKDVATAGGG